MIDDSMAAQVPAIRESEDVLIERHDVENRPR